MGFRHDVECQKYLFSGSKYPNQSSNLKWALVGQAPSCAFRSVAGFNFTVALLRYLVTSHSALYCSAAMYSKPVLELLLALLPDFLCSSEVHDHDNKWLWWRHFSPKVIDIKYCARMFLQIPLRQWGVGNVYLLVLSGWKIIIAQNPIAKMGV